MRKYQTIYADPPWPVKKIIRKCRPNQKESLDYPIMTLNEIKSLPVKDISDENAVLFLWTTQKFLPKTFELMEVWGFKYRSQE